jgi:hypothetical protein
MIILNTTINIIIVIVILSTIIILILNTTMIISYTRGTSLVYPSSTSCYSPIYLRVLDCL